MASIEATIDNVARQEFLSLYPRRVRHIYKLPQEPTWKSRKARLTSGMIDAAVSGDSNTFYGAYWGEQTHFAVIDIDAGSKYHTPEELQRLRLDLATCGLERTTLYQSSQSTGWHLYIPFQNWANSAVVERSLKAWLKFKQYDLRCGQLEVFPSGNALRLPLQFGFAWLDNSGAVILQREELTANQAVEQFLHDLRARPNDWCNTERLITTELNIVASNLENPVEAHEKAISSEGFDDFFNHSLIPENYGKGRQYWLKGLTQKDQRHEAIICIGHYLWYGDSEYGVPAYPGRFNDNARFRLIRTWIEQKHNGFSGHVKNGNWDVIEADIQRAVSWRPSDQHQTAHAPYSHLKSEKAQDRMIALSRSTGRTWCLDDWKKGNFGREDRARTAIREALGQCIETGLPISRNQIARMSGCSPNTVRKHADIWSLLSNRSGDLSRGAGSPGLVSIVVYSPITQSSSIRFVAGISKSELEESGPVSKLQHSCGNPENQANRSVSSGILVLSQANLTDSAAKKSGDDSANGSVRVEKKAEKKERIEAAESIWTAHITTLCVEKKASGGSGIIRQGSDSQEMCSFVSAESLLIGPIFLAEKLDGETKAEGQAEKKIPKDSEEISLKQLVSDYKTPFVDAYNRSKTLADGEPAKSKTLETIGDRLKSHPWADQFKNKV